MRSSLIFKLLGAFLLVIVIGAAVNLWVTSRAMHSAFSLYTTRNSQAWAEQLSSVLAEYYSQNMSWQGVDAILGSGLSRAADFIIGSRRLVIFTGEGKWSRARSRCWWSGRPMGNQPAGDPGRWARDCDQRYYWRDGWTPIICG